MMKKTYTKPELELHAFHTEAIASDILNGSMGVGENPWGDEDEE